MPTDADMSMLELHDPGWSIDAYSYQVPGGTELFQERLKIMIGEIVPHTSIFGIITLAAAMPLVNMFLKKAPWTRKVFNGLSPRYQLTAVQHLVQFLVLSSLVFPYLYFSIRLWFYYPDFSDPAAALDDLEISVRGVRMCVCVCVNACAPLTCTYRRAPTRTYTHTVMCVCVCMCVSVWMDVMGNSYIHVGIAQSVFTR